jgi:hypothetical protein
MSLKTIQGFRNTREAKNFASAIHFRATGFRAEPAAPQPAMQAARRLG